MMSKYIHKITFFLLLLTIGAVDVLAAKTIDFNLPNGYYYLGNDAGANEVPRYDGSDFSANYYMCPAYHPTINERNYLGGDKNKPLVTTCKSFPNRGKTYMHAIWYIEAATGDNEGYFYIKHYESGQYLVANGNTAPASNRRRVNMESITISTSNPVDSALFKIQSDDDGITFYISSKTQADGNNKYVNPSKANRDDVSATGDNSNTGGILGFWSAKVDNSAWHFVKAQCETPYISSYDNSTHKITIESATEGATIYYTLDGTDPTTDSYEYDESDKPIITERKVVKAMAVKTNMIDSEVATQTIVVNPNISTVESVTYNGSAQEPTVTVKDGETTISAEEYEVEYTNNTDAGTATATVSNNPGGSYYVVDSSVDFEITKASLTITAEAKEKTYGEDDPELTYTPSGLIGTDAITGELSRVEGENVGTYAIGQNTLTAGNNYAIAYTGANLTINKKTLSITAKAKSITYGDAPANDGVEYSGFVEGESATDLTGTLSYAYDYSQYDDVGSYNITPSGLTSNNYAITFNKGTLTVGQKEVGLTWSETTSFPYDGNSHCLTATATKLVNSDDITVTVTGAQTDAGNHTATASELTGEKAGNYKLPDDNTQSFTITKVALSVTANDNSITYGDAPANDGVEYSGFVGEEDESVLGGELTYAYSYSQYGDVGNSYTITPSGLTSNNYDITFNDGTLTVNKREVELEWTNTELTYNRSAQVPTATVTNLVNSDAITVTVTGAQTNVGNYTATASELNGTKAGNYKLPATNTHAFVIAPKSLGDGETIAEGITINISSQGDLQYVKDGEATLVKDEEYTCEIQPEATEVLVEIAGIGNYTGSYIGVYVCPVFTEPYESGTYVATYLARRDFAKPSDVGVYIVKTVNPSIGTVTISELDYIPKDVPVLLLSNSEIAGFFGEDKDEDTPEISAGTVNSNKLKVAPTGGVVVKATETYMYYLGEFVLTKAGTIGAGKFYVYNPNYNTQGGQPAPSLAKLMFVVEAPTGMEEIPTNENISSVSDVWYSLDGLRLNGKPTKRGMYIQNGCKILIK